MSVQELIVDPGFVHHRKIETILGAIGTEIINKAIERIAIGTPEWRKNVAIGHIYTRVMIDFCKANNIKTLEQILLDGCGQLFCSIVKTKACNELYDSERAVSALKRSLKLNPENARATTRLKELGAGL